MTTSFRAPRRALSAALLVSLLVGGLLTATPADAYNGAPWFAPRDHPEATPYDSNFPDPSIVVDRDAGEYYAYSTTTGGAYLPAMSSGEVGGPWLPRASYDQPDCVNAADDPWFNDALPCPAPWAPDIFGGRLSKQIWAPGVAKIAGQFVLYYAVTDDPRGPGVDDDHFCIVPATAPTWDGPFTDAGGCLPTGTTDPNGEIDPQPFVDDDGTPYLIWKTEGFPGEPGCNPDVCGPPKAWARQLNADGVGFAPGSTAHKLLEANWPDAGTWEGLVLEAPAPVRYQGQLYLFYSANEWDSPNYAIGYATCATLTQACEKRTAGAPLYGPHLDATRQSPGAPAPFVDLNGQLQLAYHWWPDGHTSYPSDPGCDGTDPRTGQPWCISQGQRRMAIEPVYPTGGGGLQVGGAPPIAPPTPRAIDHSCPDGAFDRNQFPDVEASSTHAKAIDCIVWWEITQGRADGTYGPTGQVNRAQMASFIARLIEAAGGDLPENPDDAFDDDNGQAFDAHEDNINKLAAAGIVSGTGPRRYNPGGTVTRAQMATFLVRAFEHVSGATLADGPNYFADDNGDTHEVRINKAGKAGFTGGFPDGSYRPGNGVQRDQMASFLARVLDLLVEEHGADTP